MLAAVYHGPEDIRLEQVPIPGIGPAEALLRVSSTGICGTDLRIFHGAHRKYPPGTRRIPGHEVVGQIAGVGRDVRGLDAGQRAFCHTAIRHDHAHLLVIGESRFQPRDLVHRQLVIHFRSQRSRSNPASNPSAPN